MLNEKRVITMTKMATYSSGKKKQCMKVTSYYKNDYIVFQTIMAILWATVGYAIIAAGALFFQLDLIIAELSFELIETVAIYVVTGYVISMLIFAVICVLFYDWKYRKSLKVAKKYYHALHVLNARYKKEK